MKELDEKTEYLKDKENDNDRDILIYKTNINKYVNNKQIYDSIIKYKDYDYSQDNLQCSNLLYNIFIDTNIMNERFNDFVIVTPDIFLNPKNYSVNIKIDKIPLILKYE